MKVRTDTQTIETPNDYTLIKSLRSRYVAFDIRVDDGEVWLYLPSGRISFVSPNTIEWRDK